MSSKVVLNRVYIIFRLVLDLLGSMSKHRKVKKLVSEGKHEESDLYIKEYTQWWAKRVFTTGKTHVEVTGNENLPKDGAVLFVGNHQSIMDIPLIMGYADKQTSFMAKIELLKVPLISGWMQSMHCTFISRSDRKQSIQAMEESVQKLRDGYSQVIFPEGTRSKGGPIKEFKKGSFKLGFRAEVPIVPVTVDGTWGMLDDDIGFKKASVKLTIHKPIETKGLTKEEQSAIPEKVQKIVSDALPKEHLRNNGE